MTNLAAPTTSNHSADPGSEQAVTLTASLSGLELRQRRQLIGDHGLCRSSPHPEHWWPEHPKNVSPIQRRAYAARLCANCPVIGHCLQYAVAADERHGIWGGQSEEQRRAVRSLLRHLDATASTAAPDLELRDDHSPGRPDH
ncbi:Transcription factor WhiB [Pedococcus dokdonensis]|uniref:Transcriptional regulator WhiB n=1 Tax=Pedococcus dokdonensis TaxID=443156 RepID=A0A1H0TYY4_9MICO|nr:WhiB family transcriptional regulator [Pedococcus dokdonensis]SDP59282.1 Transcription factor WhiB [Pedococcus dokdonensis]